MPQTDSFYPARTYAFLDDPEVIGGKSKIFLSFVPTADLQTTGDMLDYLRTMSPSPLLLRRREVGRGTCVEVEAAANPKVVFGFSPPTSNPDSDVEEIARWIRLNNIAAKLTE